jgi:NADPH:quinone reductase-like Zn-dependent oxidoreductase
MKAAVVNGPGEAPQYQAFPEPVIEEGEVLVHARAAGLHPIVKLLASGTHYSSSAATGPSVPGVDGVGVLEDGSRVYFLFVRQPWGTMAERAAAPRASLVPIPDQLEDATAAAIANPGMSAWVSLKDRVRLAPGETVLVLGATGVAGQLAIQAARQLGAKRVIAAGRNVDTIATADVDSAISLSQPEDAIREAFAAEAANGIDVIVDYLWGRPTELLLEALARQFNARTTHRTRLVEVGDSAGKTVTLAGATLRSIDLTLLGSGFGASPLEHILATIPTLFAMAAAGSLKIAVDLIPLADVSGEWNRPEKGRRIVFTV